ncbi:hypothetical protein LV779_17645 [Streptomyces thinghirensis]|nr:hypothetical protein [Streptomyces thinghirensis]
MSAASLMWRRSFLPVAVLTVAAGLSGPPGTSTCTSLIVGERARRLLLARPAPVLHPAVTVAGGALGALCVNLVHINTWSRMELAGARALGEGPA